MKISRNINIEKHNTFGIGCNAACFVEIESEKDLPDLHGNDFPKPFFCIGQGSNLLFTKDFQGTLIHFSMKGWGVVSKNDNEVIIRAEAGCVWDEFVEQTLQKGYFGLENLSLIPGTVGSSPVQNIGAYGAEASQFIQTVHVFDYEEKRFFDLKIMSANSVTETAYSSLIRHGLLFQLITDLVSYLQQTHHTRL